MSWKIKATLTVLFFVSLPAAAGELTVQGKEGGALRRLFAVCDSANEKCAGGTCKVNVTNLACEQNAESMWGNCTYKCNNNEHMLSGDQAMALFKPLAKQKKVIQKKEGIESFKDASLSCEPLKGDASVCKIKHSKIK